MTNEEMVCKANGYCKKMEYEKGDTKYAVAWLAYMAGISQSDGPNYYPVPSVEYLRWRKIADLLVDAHAIFAGWMNDECWTEWDESVRKRVVDIQYEIEKTQHVPLSQPITSDRGEGEEDSSELSREIHKYQKLWMDAEVKIHEQQTRMQQSAEYIEKLRGDVMGMLSEKNATIASLQSQLQQNKEELQKLADIAAENFSECVEWSEQVTELKWQLNDAKVLNERLTAELSEARRGWVNVSERLPERGKLVLLWNAAQLTFVVGYWNGHTFSYMKNLQTIKSDYEAHQIGYLVDHFTDRNTHWRPLPSPPEQV